MQDEVIACLIDSASLISFAISRQNDHMLFGSIESNPTGANKITNFLKTCNATLISLRESEKKKPSPTSIEEIINLFRVASRLRIFQKRILTSLSFLKELIKALY